MIQKLAALPAATKWGQIFFVATIALFAAMVLTGGSFSSYFAMLGVFLGGIVGAVTALFSLKKSWFFIPLDAILFFAIFVFYLRTA